MLDDFATELANIINDLTHHAQRLHAWDKLVVSLSDDEKMEATHEFIDMLGTVALGLPYTIKSRFAFAAAHLCHQANQAKDGAEWEDKFPDENLYLNHVEAFGAGWKKCRAFKLRVEGIAAQKFKDSSDDFRNSYNYRFSSRFVLGMTNTVTRQVNEAGQVSYAFGGNEPLHLGAMARLLEHERGRCYAAFEAFQRLVYEQVAAISAFENISNV